MDLAVKPLKQKDAGRGLAALDPELMDEFELENAGYILLNGDEDKEEVLRVWPGYSEDKGCGVIRIDGRSRQTLGVTIDETISIEKADLEPAKSVTLALPHNLSVRGNIESYIRGDIAGQAVSEGNDVIIDFDLQSSTEQSIPLYVVETEPEGESVVTDTTNIQISNYTLEHFRKIKGASKLKKWYILASRRIPSYADSTPFPLSTILVILPLSAFVIGTSFLIAEFTKSSIRVWLQPIGTITIVLLSGLTLWHQSRE